MSNKQKLRTEKKVKKSYHQRKRKRSYINSGKPLPPQQQYQEAPQQLHHSVQEENLQPKQPAETSHYKLFCNLNGKETR